MKKIITLFIALVLLGTNCTVMANTVMYEDYIHQEYVETSGYGSCAFTTRAEDGIISKVGHTAFSSALPGEANMAYKVELTQSGGTTPYLQLQNRGTDYKVVQNLYVAEFDVLIQSGSDDGVNLKLRGKTSAEENNDDTLMLLDGTMLIPDVANHVRIVFDLAAEKADYEINSAAAASNPSAYKNGTLKIDAGSVRLDYLRLVLSSGDDGVGVFWADNIKFYGYAKGPEFVAPSPVSVDSKSEKIDFTIDGNLIFDSLLNSDAITLSDGEEYVEIAQISIDSAADKIFSIYPKYNLNTNTTYTLSINSSAEVFESANIKSKVNHTFTTLADPDSEISYAAYEQDGADTIFKANIVDADNPITIISTVWDLDKLLYTKAVTCASVGEETIRFPALLPGNKIRTLIISDINNPIRVGKPLYEYVK